MLALRTLPCLAWTVGLLILALPLSQALSFTKAPGPGPGAACVRAADTVIYRSSKGSPGTQPTVRILGVELSGSHHGQEWSQDALDGWPGLKDERPRMNVAGPHFRQPVGQRCVRGLSVTRWSWKKVLWERQPGLILEPGLQLHC